jgi:hypothetical protein
MTRKNDKVAEPVASRGDYGHLALFIFKRGWRSSGASAERIIRHLQIVWQLQLQCGGNRAAGRHGEDGAARLKRESGGSTRGVGTEGRGGPSLEPVN